MGKRQVAAARRIRDALREKLGNKCRRCSTIFNLHFDCIEPRGSDHHKRMSWDTRMRFYRREHEAGNLQILCEACNGYKGATTDKGLRGTDPGDEGLGDNDAGGVGATTDEVPF